MIKAINAMSPETGARTKGQSFNRIKNILSSHEVRTPVLILSRSRIRKNLDALSRALPGVGIHYAIKSNSHPAVLEEVARSGHRFDVASFREVQLALEAGGHASEMIHSHPVKMIHEIENAIRIGVTNFVIDNPDEIEKFIPYAGRVKLLIRVKVENSSAVVNLSYKFGCRPEEVLDLAGRIIDRGIEFFGLAFHVGSQCLDNGIYIKMADMAGELIRALGSRGIETRLLDIGGGFPVLYTETVPNISGFCRPIRKALKNNIPSHIDIICEPGRFISATAVTLVASVIGKSVRSGRPWYFLDDGLYGSFSGRIYDHCRYQVVTNRNTTWKRSVLAGPTCDSFDVIYKDIILPPLETGDILVFPAMGAYCSVSASQFNCLRKAEYIVID